MSGTGGYVGPNAVLHAITEAAVAVTGARAGWIVAQQSDGLHVVAAAGDALSLLGASVTERVGTAAFVLGTGQPAALRGDDRVGEGVGALLSWSPSTVASVPCLSEGVPVGVLEVVDKANSDAFSFDDVELAGVLGTIAGAALEADDDVTPNLPSPAELSAELSRISQTDPARYAVVCGVVTAVLANG